MKKISIVTPTFNEEENIEKLCREIKIEAEQDTGKVRKKTGTRQRQ